MRRLRQAARPAPDALFATVTRAGQRRTALRALLIAGVVASVLTFRGAPFGIGLLAVIAAAVLALVLSGAAVERDEEQGLTDRALPGTTSDAVPALLRMRFWATPDLLERHTTDRLDDALLRLLPRFVDVARLGWVERAALRRLTLRWHRERPDLAVAALVVLAESGDWLLLGHALAWADRHPEEKIMAAAEAYVRQVRRR